MTAETKQPVVIPTARAVVLSKTFPSVPHKVKMFAKKTLRKLYGHSDGWRHLVMKAKEESDV